MMFRKILRGIGAVTKIAGPALAGFGVGGPIGTAVTVAGQLSGAMAKRRGKAHEAASDGAAPIHKIIAPATSMSVSAAVLVLLRLFGVDVPVESVEALLVLIPLVMHQIGNGAVNASEPR